MKKFLSLFVALAMVFSLFAGVGAKSAKAAVPAGTVAITATTQVGGTTNVKLTWTYSAADQQAFNIYRTLDNSPAAPANLVATVGPSILTYTDTATVANQGYYYKVVAIDADGLGTPGSSFILTTAATTVTLSSIAVTAASGSVAVGAADQFTATGTYSDASTADITSSVVWSTGAGAFSTTTPGLLTAATVGTFYVTATLGSVTGYTTIVVTAATATLASIAIAPNPATIAISGGTTSFTATGTGSDGNAFPLSAVTWSSNAPGASFSTSTATSVLSGCTTVGTYYVTATVGTVSSTVALTVTGPVTLASIAITPNPANFIVGGSTSFTATGTGSDGNAFTLGTVTWSSNAPGAHFSTSAATSVLSGCTTVGTYYVTATVGTITSTVTVNVLAAAATPQSITITPNPATVVAGSTVQFTAIGNYATAPLTRDITALVIWTCPAGGTFSAATNGLFTAGATSGNYIVSAMVGGVQAYAAVTVTAPVTSGVKVSGLHAVSTDTGLPTYTMGTDAYITGFISDASVTNVTLGTSAAVNTTLWSPGVVYFQIPFTATYVNGEGTYVIQGRTAAGAPVTGATASVYAKYNVSITANPSPALNQMSVIFGTAATFGGAAADGQKFALMNGATKIAETTVASGSFSFVNNFVKRGDYTVVHETAGVPDKAVYAKWSMSGSLVATTVLDPNPLYAGSAYQESYLFVGYEDGTAVTDATIAYVSGVASTWNTWTNLGNGFYKISGITPATAGNNYYTVTTGGLTLNYTLYFKPLDGTWNPTVTLVSMNPVIGGTWTFNVNYGVNTTKYIQHDNQASLTGPLGDDTFANLGGTDDQGSATATVTSTVQTGGKISLQLDVLLWPAGTTALTANPMAVKQVFAINPAITGDLTTVDTSSVNVGDTKDITVTVKKPSGVERNNGLVTLKSTVAGMFTAPYGASYSVSGDGTSVTMDARTLLYNVNIVGGKYVFAGLKFNHRGSIDVLVYDGSGNLSADLVAYITVSPTMHTLTSDTAKFVAGQVYPVVKISGAVAGLTFVEYDPATALYDISPSYVDMGSGNYTFNFAAGIPSFTADGIKLRATSGDDRYQIVIPVVKPTITITSVHTDGLITKGVTEKVIFTVTDPITGAAMIPSAALFKAQFNYWDVTGNTNLQVSQVTNGTTVLDATSSIKANAITGNDDYVDYTVDKPYIKLSLTINGQAISYSNFLLVTAAQITVTPSDLVLYYGRDNTFSVKALDAHGAALEGENVIGTNNYLQTPEVVTFGGITGADGVVSFHYTPNYVGEIYIESKDLGLTIANDTGITLQINPAPVDTTAPVITITKGIDGSTVTSDTLTLTGTVTDNVGVSQVYVGMNKVDLLPDGSFQTTVKLAAGDNTITVTAYDAAGNKATATAKVTYTAPKAGTVIVLTIGTDIVTVNGKATSVAAAPEIVNGRTFVPLRFIAETFGADVEWLAETQGITITLGDDTIGLQIGNATAVINGNITALDAAPYIKNSSTMVPLRVISEAFGGNVAWDPALRTITITYVQP